MCAIALSCGAGRCAGKGSPKHPSAHATVTHGSSPAAAVPREAHARIARDPRAKCAFRRAHPCPTPGATRGPCNGYVIDHVVPLKRGGADALDNMQWLTRHDAKLKDRIE
jgi:hypothetical protein